MPEGDTLYQIAARLGPMIVGQRILAATATERRIAPATLAGTRVTAVEARGKHLLIALDDGTTLHTHLGMTGSWHRYRPGERWGKPRHHASLTLSFERWVVVCFSAELLERLESRRQEIAPTLSGLGPDVLKPGFDTAAVVERMRRSSYPLGVLILDQTILAGVGNVYKSEGLFLEKLDPFSRATDHAPDVLARWIERNRALMRRNLDGRPRRTHGPHGPRFWVYRRQDEACLVCGDKIRMRRQGEMGRSTYWCPSCQSAAHARPVRGA